MCVKIDSWTVLNVICVSAAFIQLVFIIANYINPDQLNTISNEISLNDIGFPLDIKICAEPAFNQNALEESGYDRLLYKYFTGRSRYNPSVFGWAGRNNENGTLGK